VVGERDLRQHLTIDVAVERGPAAVLVLHAEQPAQPAFRPRPGVGRRGVAGARQGHQHMAVSSVSG